MSIRIPLIALAVSFAAPAFAQDSLFYTNGNVIVGQVTEIGLNVVKYRTNSDGHAVLIEVDKHDLAKVKLKDGQAYAFDQAHSEVPYSEAFLGRKHVLSLDVVAPFLNHVMIGYEQLLGPRISLLVQVGYIGLWNGGLEINEMEDSKGGLLTAGVKFMLPRSAKRTALSNNVHPLASWYLAPELMFSTWTRTYEYPVYGKPYPHYLTQVANEYSSAAIVLNVGREFFLGEHFTCDVNGGVGYGAEWCNGKAVDSSTFVSDIHTISRQDYAFTHRFIGSHSPLVVSGGLRLGYAF